MKKSYLTLFVLIAAQILFSQDRIISGRIFDSEAHPIIGVWICQDKMMNCTTSDFDGTFHLLIDDHLPDTLHFSHLGYFSLIISEIDTIDCTIQVTLLADESSDSIEISEYSRFQKNFGFYSSIQVDFLFSDFSDFSYILGEKNIDFMKNSRGILSIEMGGSYMKHYFGLNIGFSSRHNMENDSIDIEFNRTQYGLHYGYNIISTKHVLITPKVALKWNKYRLLNYSNQRKIPIEEYIDKRDLDIRFNQMTGQVGVNILFKVYHGGDPTEYFGIGVYGGYIFKLTPEPWVFSTRNRLVINDAIQIENYYFGIQFSFNIEGGRNDLQ